MPFDESAMQTGILPSTVNLAVADSMDVAEEIAIFNVDEISMSWARLLKGCISVDLFPPGLYERGGFKYLHPASEDVELVEYNADNRVKRTQGVTVGYLLNYTVPSGWSAIATFRSNRRSVEFKKSILTAFNDARKAELHFFSLYLAYNLFLHWDIEGNCIKVKFKINSGLASLLGPGKGKRYINFEAVTRILGEDVRSIHDLHVLIASKAPISVSPQIKEFKKIFDSARSQWVNFVVEYRQGWIKVGVTEDIRILAYNQLLSGKCVFVLSDGSVVNIRATDSMKLTAEHVEYRSPLDK